MFAGFKVRVFVAEDEAVTNLASTIAKIFSFDLYTVITDLNFGITGPSGDVLLQNIEKEHPLG